MFQLLSAIISQLTSDLTDCFGWVLCYHSAPNGAHTMVLNAESIEGIAVVSLRERLNSANCPTFQKDIKPLMQENSRFVFDLTQVKNLDSSALGTLVACLKHLRGVGGDLRLCGMSKQIRALFELVRMHHMFDVFNTRQEALDSYK